MKHEFQGVYFARLAKKAVFLFTVNKIMIFLFQSKLQSE